MIRRLEQEQFLPISLDEAWAFFSTPKNLEEITPDELGFEVQSGAEEPAHDGQIITYRVKILPGVRLSWVTELKSVEERVAFVDEQRFGPFKFWHHRHSFEEVEGGVLVRDRVHYDVGWWIFGRVAEAVFVRKQMEFIFAERRRVLAARFGGAE
jgi:ligand-binding SRPBCC domain-containing protein